MANPLPPLVGNHIHKLNHKPRSDCALSVVDAIALTFCQEMNDARDISVELVDEQAYTFRSADNCRKYESEIDLTEGYLASSVHGLIIDGKPKFVIGASGGASGVHPNSMLRNGPHVFVAVGAFVVRFTLGSDNLDWKLEIDEATCFGLHYNSASDALISHGELSISRFSREGKILWSSGGADIFSEGFLLRDHCVEAIDFYQRAYRFDYATGNERAEQGVDPNA